MEPKGSVQPLGEVHFDVVTVVLADGLADGSSNWELVGAVAQGHERPGERLTVDSARDLDQTARAEDLCRVGQLDASPGVPGRALPRRAVNVMSRACGVAMIVVLLAVAGAV